jgi:hypothetical protein
MKTLRVPISPEQEELIADYAFSADKQLGIYTDERIWMIQQARKQLPGCVVKSADLDIAKGQWVLEVEA